MNASRTQRTLGALALGLALLAGSAAASDFDVKKLPQGQATGVQAEAEASHPQLYRAQTPDGIYEANAPRRAYRQIDRGRTPDGVFEARFSAS